MKCNQLFNKKLNRSNYIQYNSLQYEIKDKNLKDDKDFLHCNVKLLLLCPLNYVFPF